MTLTSSPYTVLAFVDEVRVKYIIPQKKVFLTGLSYISFKTGLKDLERSFDETLLFFSALVPISALMSCDAFGSKWPCWIKVPSLFGR